MLLGQWHGPRDPKLVRAPSTVVGFHAVLRPRPLCGCFAPVPDATTRCRFRNPR
ncbi:MAG: hypothetical protein GDA36_11300 [Rhodobacteraceae bacterium]|nr:hypothetical protein [Paracoccaceae bacterium]